LVLTSIVIGSIFWSNKSWRWLFLGSLLLSFGLLRYQLALPQTNYTKIWFYNQQKVEFIGVVASEPDQRINQVKLVIQAQTISGRPINGKVLISANLYPSYQYGDQLLISCTLESPAPINDFAYDRYLAKDGIYSLCYYPKVKLLQRDQGDWWLTQIFKIKGQFWQVVKKNLPEPQASLFFAINFGNRGGIPADVADSFNITGTTHLIAISGMNITIICSLLLQLFLFLSIPRKKAFWLSTAVLFLYVIMVGFPASAVRASIMGWLVLLAMQVGRLNYPTNALIFTATAMLIINPKILRDDAGFSLSFLAVSGLIYLYPVLKKHFEKVPASFGLKEIFLLTLSAQITTLPLIIYSFGRVSLVGLVVNLLVISVFPPLTILGFIALFLSFIFPAWAFYFFWPVWLILGYVLTIIEHFSLIPYAAITF
jgi:competence protein ComEC